MNRIQKIELAKTLYFRTDKSQKEICKIVGWTENTFTRNKVKEYWDEQKAASILTNDQIISELRKQAKKITDMAKTENRALTNSEVDSISKIASSIEKLSTKVGLSTIIESFMRFTDWLKISNTQKKVIEITELFDEYIKYLISGSEASNTPN